MTIINTARLSQATRDQLRDDEPDDGRRRLPLTRGDCPDLSDGPCPYVSCRHHLFLDVNASNGSIKLNFPDLLGVDGVPELDEMPATCSLDVADKGGVILERIGEMFNVTRERARQLETAALERMRQRLAALGYTDSHEAPNTMALYENPYVIDEP